jgi:hypothetical protein
MSKSKQEEHKTTSLKGSFGTTGDYKRSAAILLGANMNRDNARSTVNDFVNIPKSCADWLLTRTTFGLKKKTNGYRRFTDGYILALLVRYVPLLLPLALVPSWLHATTSRLALTSSSA